MSAPRGLEPMITLHHFTHPAFLGEEFWLRPGSPDRFARHVARIVPALASHCRRWVTVNEPNIVMLMGWIEGAHPPGRRAAFADAFCVLDNLLTAHVLAADAILAVQPEAQVTSTTSSSSLYEHDRLLTDLLLPGPLPDVSSMPSTPHRTRARSVPSDWTGTTPSPVTHCRCRDAAVKWVDGTGPPGARSGTCRCMRTGCVPGAAPRRRFILLCRYGWWRTEWPPGWWAAGPLPAPTAGIVRAFSGSTSPRWSRPQRRKLRSRPTCTGPWSTTTSGAPTSRALGSSAWTGAIRPAQCDGSIPMRQVTTPQAHL